METSFREKLEFTVNRFLYLFVIFFILFVPLPLWSIPSPGEILRPLSEKIIQFTADKILGIHHPYSARLLSDSTGMYILVLIIFIPAFCGSIIWTVLKRNNKPGYNGKYWLHAIFSYYLAIILLTYGWDKLFKAQFYLPEPNTLYTPLGYLSKDILYWSTIGSSHSYSVFLGLSEVIPGILLLFRKTRPLGAIAAMIVMINVVMINFSYDISVKVFSCFLLLLCLILSYAPLKKIFFLLIFPARVSANPECFPPVDSKKRILVYSISKAIAIGLIFYVTLFKYVVIGNLNDDNAPRPFLHGAYAVGNFISGNDTIPPMESNKQRWKRFFIHRQGYFIVQFMNDSMKDYKLEYDDVNKKLILQSGGTFKNELSYSTKEKNIILNGNFLGKELHINAAQLDLNDLPLLKKDFHWTVDQQ